MNRKSIRPNAGNAEMNRQIPTLNRLWDVESQSSPHWGALSYAREDSYSRRSIDSPSTISESSSSSLSTHDSSYSFLSTHGESACSPASGFSALDPSKPKAVLGKVLDAKKAKESIEGGAQPRPSALHPPKKDVEENNGKDIIDHGNADSSEGWVSDSISPESSPTSISSNSQIADYLHSFRIDPPSNVYTKVRDSRELASPIVMDHDSSAFKRAGTCKKEACEEALPLRRGQNPYPQRKAKCATPFKVLKPSSAYHHGCFRFAEQDGSPCFSFSLKGSDEVLFARASKTQARGAALMYIFYRRKDSAGDEKGGWIKRVGPKKKKKKKKQQQLSGDVASDVVAKMKVCHGEAKSAASREKGTGMGSETCFVLLGDARRSGFEDRLLREGSNSSNISMERRGREVAELASIVITTSSSASSRGSTIAAKEDRSNHSQAHTRSSRSSNSNGSGNGDDGVVEVKRERGWGLNFLGLKDSDASTAMAARIRSSQCQATEKLRLRDLLHAPEEHHPWKGKTGVNAEAVWRFPSGFFRRGSGSSRELRVVVILPSGKHGEPRNDSSKDDDVSDDDDDDSDSDDDDDHHHHHHGHHQGLTPLLDRWRSGGDCDCGGWDLGCGLVVLESESRLRSHEVTSSSSSSSSMMTLTSLDLLASLVSPGRPLIISTQGSERERAFVLEAMEGGLFSLSFRDGLSPLQAFATAVAIFHQQIKD